MSKILLVVGHQKSAQGAVNRELSISEWEFNSRLVPMIAERLGDMAVVLNRDIPHWKKAPVINELHAKTPFVAVVEFHLNSCDKDKKVNYCLAKYARGSKHGQELSIELLGVLKSLGLKPAQWAETSPAGVFPTDKTPPKDQQNGEWWDKNGWRYRGATFLWKTQPPAVLLEPFFISCTDFLKATNSPGGLDRLAVGFADAIKRFVLGVV